MSLITSTGKNLSVLICSDYTFAFNWMSFAAWYSVRKNLPEADIAVTSARNFANIQLYNWAYRSGVKFFLHKNVGKNSFPYLNKIYGVYVALKEELVKPPVIVIDADMMAIREFSNNSLNILNNNKYVTNKKGTIWYFGDNCLEKITETINKISTVNCFDLDHLDLSALNQVFGEPVVADDLGNDTYESDVTTFTHYKERCGNFFRKEYEKGLVHPPFKNQTALRTVDMTVSEKKVFSLWLQMWNTFEALSK